MKKTLSHYEILRELGRGGMATVYEAIDINSQRRVALKVLLPQFSTDKVMRTRFLREAGAGMKLEHPGIARVYEVAEVRNESFMAMELIEGRTLDELIEEEVFDVERVIDVGLKVADALAAAHEKGIIHRDIKPQNIMVSNGRVKVMDFGLVRITEASRITSIHEIVGTLHYMSPQQATGIEIDERSDIFSLGVVLYQLLTGTLPFEGDHPGAIIHSILHSDPLRMDELREGIPIEVEQVVFKALQKKPQDRYQTAAELRSDLETVTRISKGNNLRLIASEEVFAERIRGFYSPLVGRESELRMLEDRVDRMLKGDGSTILVSGHAGIGKSRLIWEVARKAKREKVRYFAATCVFGKELPYRPVLEVIRSYLELKGVRSPERLSNFIKEKAPHLADRMAVIQTLLLMMGEKETSLVNKEQLWDTATELVKVMAQDRPVLLHLDDLHWADAPTLNLFGYLSANTRGERILIAATYRREELSGEPRSHFLLSVLEKMRKEGLYEEINLERLDEKQTDNLICSVFAHSHFPEAFTKSMFEETEGNPLFVLETLKLLQDQGIIVQENGGWRLTRRVEKFAIPKRVNDVIRNRLSSLSREERILVEVASVQGRSFQSDPLSHCLGLPRMKVLRGLHDLEQSHYLIHSSEREYHFDHGKIRDAVYESLIPELRKEYHRLLAEYFARDFGEREEYAGKIAHHLLEADQKNEALPHLIKAGQSAKKLFANEEAVRYFDKGIEVVNKLLEQQHTPDLQRTRLTLLKGRAEVKALIGSYDDARVDYEDIIRVGRSLQDPKEEAHGLSGFGATLRKRDDEIAMTYYQQALGIQREIADKLGEGSTLMGLGGIHYDRDDYDTALRCFQESLQIQRQIENKRGEGSALNGIGNIHYNLGNYDTALDHFGQSLQIWRELGDRLGEGNALNNIGNVHLDRGHYDVALSSYEQSLAIKRQIGDKLGEANVLNNIGNIYATRGDFLRSLTDYEESLEIQRQIGNRLGEGDALGNIGYVYWNRADYEMALSRYEQSLAVRKEIRDKEGQWESQHHLCKLWLNVGDREKALGRAKEAARIAETVAAKKMNARFRIDTGLAKLLRGDYTKAHLDIGKGLEIARKMMGIDAIIEALELLTEVEIQRGNGKKASQYAEEALGLASRKEKKPDAARAHLLHSRIHLSQGDLREAEFHASEALGIARGCGMKEQLWHAHHYLGKIALTRKDSPSAQLHLHEAVQIVEVILSNLTGDMAESYRGRSEVKELYAGLESVHRRRRD
ncbi:MAG: hypothetical protein AMJ46_13515 [Latescibacteria bacterium DG_63]|nr:MAG: hypothetical protein AMJ46_13515 [Latescibacteria bacterium DG_63]